jgi:hypothetical protein
MRRFLATTGVVGALVAIGAIWADPTGARTGYLAASFFVYWAILNGVAWIAVWGRQRWKEVLLCALAIAGSLAVAEVVLRAALPHRAARVYRHQRSGRYHHVSPANGTTYRGYYDGKHVWITTNEDGLRSGYSRRDYLQYPTRLLVLGDSFTFGFGVRQEALFTQVLEDELRRKLGRDDIAVLNTGCISYSPLLERRLFEDLAPLYKPQHVLLFLDPGDVGDDLRYATLVREADLEGGRFYPDDAPPHPYYGAVWQLTRPYHALVTEPFHVWRRLTSGVPRQSLPTSLRRQIEVKLDGKVERDRFFIYRHPLEKTRPYFDATAEHLDAIAGVCRQFGATFTLFVLPRYHHWNPEESPNNWERSLYALDEPYQFEYFRYFQERRDQVDYRIVNLLDDFKATDEFPLVFDEDPHWNERGNAFVGRTVSAYVLEGL